MKELITFHHSFLSCNRRNELSAISLSFKLHQRDEIENRWKPIGCLRKSSHKLLLAKGPHPVCCASAKSDLLPLRPQGALRGSSKLAKTWKWCEASCIWSNIQNPRIKKLISLKLWWRSDLIYTMSNRKWGRSMKLRTPWPSSFLVRHRTVRSVDLSAVFHWRPCSTTWAWMTMTINYTSSYTMIQSDSQESVQLVDVGVWEMRGKVKPSAPGGPPEEPAELGEELSRSPALSGTSDGRWFASPTSVDTFRNPDLCPSLPDRCRCHCVKVL